MTTQTPWAASLHMAQVAILNPIMLTGKMNHHRIREVWGGQFLEKVKGVGLFQAVTDDV